MIAISGWVDGYHGIKILLPEENAGPVLQAVQELDRTVVQEVFRTHYLHQLVVVAGIAKAYHRLGGFNEISLIKRRPLKWSLFTRRRRRSLLPSDTFGMGLAELRDEKGRVITGMEHTTV